MIGGGADDATQPMAFLWSLTEAASVTWSWVLQMAYCVYLFGVGPWFWAHLLPLQFIPASFQMGKLHRALNRDA